MDSLQFFAAVISSLAWPLTTLALVALLHEPVGRLLTMLTRLKYKDLELDFGRELRQIEEDAKAVEVLPTPKIESAGGPKEPDELLDEAEMLVGEFPQPAIAVAWSAVEDDLSQAAERLTRSSSFRREPTIRVIKSLVEGKAIDRGTADVLKRMQNLRNAALHERWNAFGGISTEEAREFIALARGIHERLSNIGRE